MYCSIGGDMPRGWEAGSLAMGVQYGYMHATMLRLFGGQRKHSSCQWY